MLKSSAFVAASLAAAANATIEPEHPYAFLAWVTGYYFAMSEFDDIQEIQRCVDWTYEEFNQVEEALEYAQSDEPWTAFFILMGVQIDVNNYTESCNLEQVHQQARQVQDQIKEHPSPIRIIFNTGKYEKEIEQAAIETQLLLEEGHYFQAGLATATIVQMSLGYENVHDMSEPVFPHEVEAAAGVVTADSYLNMVETKWVATFLGQMVAASLAETLYLNHMSGIGDCAYATTDFIQAIEQLYLDFKDDKQVRLLTDLVAAQNIFKSNLELCEAQGAPEDVTSLIAYVDRTMTSRKKLVDAASAGTLLHGQEVERHVQEVWDVVFSFNQPVAFGKAISRVAYWALGPVDPTADPM